MKMLSRRPSASMAVAFIALVAALSGTAVALPGKNKVDSGDIKNGQVKGSDLAKNAVTGAKIKANTVKGADVDESSLGTVPTATAAGSANTANTATSATNAVNATNAGKVNGFTIYKVFYRNASATPLKVFDAGGLQISASCNTDTIAVVASTSKNDSSIYTVLEDTESSPGGDLSNDAETQSFGVNSTFDLLAGADSSQSDPAILTFEYDAVDHTTITGTLAIDESSGPDGDQCSATGNVTVG